MANEISNVCCEIPLSNGGVAYCDPEDYPLLSRHTWSRSGGDERTQYARTSLSQSTSVSMHRLVFGPAGGRHMIDHIDRNGLNNRKSNLRVASANENGWNKERKQKNAQCPYKGVYPSRGRFCSSVRGPNYKKVYLGSFKTPEEAAEAYDAWVVANRGEFGVTNRQLGLLK